jgi:hypothetical protein
MILSPTASKVAHALLVCIGDVTRARVSQRLDLARSRTRNASVRVVNTESTKMTLVGLDASATTRSKSAESETVLSPSDRCSRDTATTFASPAWASDRPVTKRSKVSCRIVPSGANPAERTTIASTRAGIESRRKSVADRAETSGVYATITQRAAMIPAGAHKRGRNRVAPTAAPNTAAGR